MSHQRSTCPHINIIGNCTKEDIIAKQEASICDSCNNTGPNLFVCLHQGCLYVGCNDEPVSNHANRHFRDFSSHCLVLNLTILRVWCRLCETEVFLENNDPPISGMLPPHPLASRQMASETDSEEEFDSGDDNLKPRGLTGLQNLGNTCYMNSAIQALSNCPQLTNFFLDCGAFVQTEKKSCLAHSYMKLVKEMWHKRRPSYVVPSSISHGIKMVFPVFRGYTQQDAQEFLRCFMDQLHEELKEPLVEIPGNSSQMNVESQDDFDICHGGDQAVCMSEDSSQSEAEFETCDSGLSSDKSSCADEMNVDSESNVEREELRPGRSQTPPHKQSTTSYHPLHHANKPKHVYTMNRETGEQPELMQQKQGDNFLGKGECASDSGVPYNASMDTSESESFIDRKSHNSIRRGERYGSYSSLGYSSRQASQLHGVSTHSILSSMFARRRKPVQFRSIISDTFDGKLLSSVQCLTCDTVSTTKETFQDLSLPIPNRDHLHMIHASQGNLQKSGGACTDVYSHQGWFSWIFGWMLSWFWGPAVSLQDCLSAFFSADELKGDNMYSCEKCKKLRNGVKYSKVIELPEILCIHLKRFRHEVMFSSKISSYVTFPLDSLDMSAFLHNSYPRGVTTYDLAAVICHHGTAGSGHYTAYAMNNINDQWYEFDDQYVTAVDPEIVRHCEAYVLFYRKSGDEMLKKRHCAVELLERSKNEQELLKFHVSKQWVNKFNNFAEPGPISNTDFLCVHGGVPPHKASYVNDLCITLPQAVWEYLHDTFGGGPSCTHLYICPTCQTEQDNLTQRRRIELDHFIALNNQFKTQDNPSVVFAISMNWFKIWEKFVRGKENEPPGPIDNSSICYVKNNQAALKLGSDYGSLSEDMWRYLFTIYGGGPDIVLQPNSSGGATATSCSQFSSSPNASPVTTRSMRSASGNATQQSGSTAHSFSRVNVSTHQQQTSPLASTVMYDQDTNKVATVTDKEMNFPYTEQQMVMENE